MADEFGSVFPLDAEFFKKYYMHLAAVALSQNTRIIIIMTRILYSVMLMPPFNEHNR